MRQKFLKESQQKVIHYCHSWLKQQTSIYLRIRMSQRSQRIFQPMYTGCSSLTLNNSLFQISIMALTLYIPSRQSEFTENIDLLDPSVWIHLQQEIRQPLREDIQNDSFPEATKWYQCWKCRVSAPLLISEFCWNAGCCWGSDMSIQYTLAEKFFDSAETSELANRLMSVV